MKYYHFFLFMFVFLSCTHDFSSSVHKKRSFAQMMPVGDSSSVQGWVYFQSVEDDKMRVKAEISGLRPHKLHGFHIHRYGDCRNEARQVGPHLNPYHRQHGFTCVC